MWCRLKNARRDITEMLQSDGGVRAEKEKWEVRN